MKQSADEVLVLRAQLGDRRALTILIERWHPAIWRFLRYHTEDRDGADDLCQDVWIAVLRNLATLRQPDRFRSWLFTIARRTATDRLRRRYRRPQDRFRGEAEEGTAAQPDDFVTRIADRGVVADRIARLDIRDRAAVSLYYLDDFSVSDVAEILGVPVGTVKSRLARARHRMADHTNRTAEEEPT